MEEYDFYDNHFMKKPLTFKTTWPFVLVSLTLVFGPLLVAWLLTPREYVFIGTLVNNNDFSGYLAAMRQGADGNWLFHFNFSPEKWQPQLMLPLYIILGKIVPDGLGYAMWANVFRVFALLLTLLMFGIWVRQIFPNMPTKQWVAWLLLVFGGGLGWLLFPLANLLGFTDSASLFPDITDSGWGVGLIGANAPHYMLGLFLETLFFWSFWRVTKSESWKWVWATAFIGLVVGLVYVYNITVIFAVVVLHLLWRFWEERHISWSTSFKAGLILAPLLPLLFYYGYWINRDPVWARYVVSSHNHIPPPPWYALIWGAGFVGILAAIGVHHWWKTKQNPLLIFWIVGNLLVMYVPFVQYSGRFILGLWVPLATLAAFSLEEVVLPWLSQKAWYDNFRRLTPTPYESLRRIILILTVPSGFLVAFFFIKNISIQPDFPFYMPKNEIQAMKWLSKRTNPETDLIFAYYPVGNYFPQLSDTRVFMGQFFLTVDYEKKLSQVKQFWQANTPNSWRQALVKKWHITYIYQGMYENALYQGNITPPGRLVYDQVGVKIYYTIP